MFFRPYARLRQVSLFPTAARIALGLKCSFFFVSMYESTTGAAIGVVLDTFRASQTAAVMRRSPAHAKGLCFCQWHDGQASKRNIANVEVLAPSIEPIHI